MNPDQLAAAREAFVGREWDRALDLFEGAAEVADLAPEDLEMTAEAAFWAARPDRAIEALERAYAGYIASGRNARAAYVAIALSREHGVKLAGSVAAGWLNRAKRLLETEPEGREHGYLYGRQSLQAMAAGHHAEAIDLARRMAAVGRATGDRDLVAVAAMYEGMALVEDGKAAEGLSMIDEAALSAVSGELSLFITGSVFCNMIATCCDIADYRRAGEWIEAAEQRGVRTTPGDCRIHEAEILVLRGSWAEAEESARRGTEELRGYNRLVHVGEGHYQIAEIRRRVGDFDAAHEGFRRAGEFGRDPQPGLSLLLLAQGKAPAALASIKRALDEDPTSMLMRMRLLPAFIEISLATGDTESAGTATDELESIASVYDAPALHAAACHARGAVLLAEGDHAAASRSLRRAVGHWSDVGAPYETARSRVLLARAFKAHGDDEGASMELHAARATFERLNAAPDPTMIDSERSDPATAVSRDVKTFVFTDIVRSTNLVEAMGDEAWIDLLRWHDQTLRALFAEYRGEEVDHAGDGFFVAFDDADSALSCAVAIQRTLANHRRLHGFAPTVRIGVHAAQATKAGAGYKGKGVHEAARIGSIAEGGEILASRETLTPGMPFDASETRKVELKGLSVPVDVVTVQWRP